MRERQERSSNPARGLDAVGGGGRPPKQRKKPPRLVSRQNFIEICAGLTAVDEQVFKDLWQKLGLSIDWSLEYATIDDRCRGLAQR